MLCDRSDVPGGLFDVRGRGEVSVRPPFPYFGGKSRIAPEVWRRLGDCPNYVEPFFGSGAMLLARPDAHRWWERIETVNDADGMVSNFWRAVARDPELVAHHAGWPIVECDLHARHAWLVGKREAITARLEGDPEWFDAKAAGWWVWGISSWIGSGWCSGNGPWHAVNGELVNVNGNAGRGINRSLPHLGNAGRGINRSLPHLRNAGRGVCAAWSAHLIETMQGLADRLRRVRVCCGDWERVCTDAVTTRHGITAVFFDPPYALAERTGNLYAIDSDVDADARRWAIERGNDPLYRIALCSYGDTPLAEGWTRVAWKAAGGYGSQGNRARANSSREVVDLSPHCLSPTQQRDLFTLAGVAV